MAGDTTTGLEAKWLLQDDVTSGGGEYTVAEATGNHVGTLNGGDTTHTLSAAAGLGPGSTLLKALKFDGTADYVSASPTGILKNKAGGTITFWMKTTSASNGEYFVGVSKGDASTSARLAVAIVTGGKIAIYIRSLDADTPVTTRTNVTGSFKDGVWYHVAAVVDFVNRVVALYVNGQSITTTGTISFTAGNTSNTDPNNVNLAGMGASGLLDTSLADVRIYGVAKTAEDIEAIRLEGGLPYTTVAPTFTGSGIPGEELACTLGTWVIGTEIAAPAVGWLQYDGPTGDEGLVDLGSSNLTYTPTEAQLGKYVVPYIYAQNPVGVGTYPVDRKLISYGGSPTDRVSRPIVDAIGLPLTTVGD